MLMLFLLLSQYPFGQNKVQYKEYKWMTNETTHFTIYYHTGDEPLVSFGESVLESTYDFLKRDLFYREMKNEEKIPVIIYGSHNEFEETNILLERIPESVGGFTESFKNRVVVPFDGSYKDFRHVLSHELVHVFQNRIWYGEGFGSINRRMTMNI
ncbi:MAG TPA: biopolymer transporter Tol, partial [candidate division WOR-3 bacterium]|nr:biopolymer transporter Tol [candidate division WOR-3 bacterium]